MRQGKSGQAPTVAEGSAEVSNERLANMARLLRDWRANNGLGNQADVGLKLSNALGRLVSQSFVAQLEAGKIKNPDSTLLEAIAQSYGGSYNELVAAVVVDKYKLSPFTASLLTRDIKDIVGLVEWENNLPAGTELWIAAPNFVDADSPEVRNAVVGLLKRSCKVVYFVDESDNRPGGKFDKFRSQLSNHPEIGHSTPLHVDLNSRQLAELQTSTVIADPLSAFDDNPKTEGYLVVNKDGDPEFGIKMSTVDVVNRVTLLRGFSKMAKPMKLERVA